MFRSGPASNVDITPKSTTSVPATKKTQSQPADLLGQVGFQSSANDLLIPADSPRVHNIDDASFPSPSSLASAPLKFQSILRNESASVSRPTAAIHFHSKYDNILLTGHGARSDGKIGAPQGTIAVWASDQSDSPLQRTLIASAPITTLQLFPISPTLVLGGTSIGSIHLWDLRVKTALSVAAFDRHAVDISDCHGRHAVTSIRTTAAASPFFITTSANGHICKWSLSQTNGPLSQSSAHDPVVSDKVPIRTMDFPRSTRLSADDQKSTNRSPSLFVGTSHGSVCRLETDGKLWNVAPERGTHNAPVTSVRTHPGGMHVSHLDDVIATSSFDWSINVWHFRRGQDCKKLWTHDNSSNGTIYDMAWSTMHPTVVCYGDEAGVLSLHDLSGHLRNKSTGLAGWMFASNSSGKGRRPPITTLQWSNNDRFICTGDKLGNIGLWSTTSHMASLPDAEWMATFLKSKAQRS